ncbi:hypothetical protein KQI89_12080 [Clostridium sp. MSJ-4]|uniref:Uncharacterized protein n=1 Tax=Clostridium simiarum TaxID=2841506 RepID=A0ABS6F4F5_9CLOT|nr:hypothetical protein [Clostridium simiarum]MBU5592493.1 hypothetical protein [Clostridium simiarum]
MLKDGLNYNNYTAKIKATNEELIYDKETVGAFFYENSDGEIPKSVVVVITENTTQKTQEVTINKN